MHIRCSECGHDNAVKDFVVSSLKTFFNCGSCKNHLALSIIVEQAAMLEMNDGETKMEQEAKRGRTLNKLSVYFKEVYQEQEEVFTPVLSAVAGEIIGLVSEPDSDSTKVARCIERDQVIAAKMLRMANSAFYQGMKKISDLKNAVTRIGMKQVSSIVLGSITQDLHRSKGMKYDGLMTRMWDHALMCGVAAREIARKTNYPDVETAFVSGLLHDIGKVVLLGMGHEATTGKLKTDIEVTNEVLMEVLNEIHCEIGMNLMERWEMPEELIQAVGHHHEPWLAEKEDCLPQIVNLADFFCKKLSNSLVPQPNVNLASERSAEVLGFNEISLADIEVELEDQTNEMKQVL